MGKYDWIKPGAKVRIKTEEEIHQMYPSGMPCCLTYGMKQYCGTIQIVDYIQPAGRSTQQQGVTLVISICSWHWPNTVLSPAITKLGNSLI